METEPSEMLFKDGARHTVPEIREEGKVKYHHIHPAYLRFIFMSTYLLFIIIGWIVVTFNHDN